MDRIRQYQRLSDIKPAYQKLTEPLYNVSKARFYLSSEELVLIYEGMGMYREASNQDQKRGKKGGSDFNDSVLMVDLTDLDDVNDMADV